jgi:hypothetical protein
MAHWQIGTITSEIRISSREIAMTMRFNSVTFLDKFLNTPGTKKAFQNNATIRPN